jgi:tRNA threonylcarbamoyladenosine biosynthesis protein TsaE
VLALRGGLGAGKTCLARGVAAGLGVSEQVSSPTYTIISEYQGRLPFYHIDAYRLQSAGDFADIGGEDILYGEGLALVEWSERIESAIPHSAIRL